MSEASSSQVTSAPKRACDACHRRKVRCVPVPEESPAASGSTLGLCRNCKNSGLVCTYDAVPQKKGPKGSRAKVISELKENQQRRDSVTSTLKSSPTPPGALALSRSSTNISQDLIEFCVDYFFDDVYATQPILDRRSINQSISSMQQDSFGYCLVVSLCAYMLIQPGMQLSDSLLLRHPSAQTSTLGLAMTLLQDALDTRKSLDGYDNPGIAAVQTSFFLYCCYFNLEKHSTAWAYLRDASTVSLLLNMHQEYTYRNLPLSEANLRRRLYWLLFVTERAYALQTQRPLTLYDTIDLPIPSQHEGLDAGQMEGFIHLARLFKPFDHNFINAWNQSIESHATAAWISSLQKQLSEALPQYLRGTEVQAVDLKTSQQWLRIMIWQFSISHKLLSSTATDEAMTFRFPLELSRQFLQDTSHFSQESMEVHGIGLIKKLFDIACTLIDVISFVPLQPPTGFEMGPRQYLEQFIQLISKLRGGQTRYLPLLMNKINETLPALGSSVAPQGLPSSVMMGRQALNLSAMSMTSSPFEPEALKSEYSEVSGTSQYGSQYGDETMVDSSPFPLQPQSSYSG